MIKKKQKKTDFIFNVIELHFPVITITTFPISSKNIYQKIKQMNFQISVIGKRNEIFLSSFLNLLRLK